MKRWIVIGMLLLGAVAGNAQEKLAFSKVIPVEGFTKADIFVSLKEWFALNFVSARNVIEVEDKEAGIIVGNTLFDYEHRGLIYTCYKGRLEYTINIQIRDGRFKVTMTNFEHRTDGGVCSLGMLTVAEVYKEKGANKRYENIIWKDLKEKAKLNAEEMIAKLEKIEFKKFNDEGEDW